MSENKIVYWSPEEDNLLKELYIRKAKKTEVLLAFPHRSYSSTKYRAKILKIKKIRLQYKNEAFFNIPNETNSAVAGILASDGCICKKNKGNCNRIMLGVKLPDEELLNQVLNITNSNATIYRQTLKRTFKNIIRAKDNTKREYQFSNICWSACEQWIPDLERYWNITERKSLTLLPPNINELNLCLAYICGIISGDGSIGIQKTKDKQYIFIRIWGTKELLDWIKVKFEEFLKEKIEGIPRIGHEGDNVYGLQINGVQAIKLFRKMNSIHCVKLNRKWSNPEVLKIINNYKFKTKTV